MVSEGRLPQMRCELQGVAQFGKLLGGVTNFASLSGVAVVRFGPQAQRHCTELFYPLRDSVRSSKDLTDLFIQ